MVDVTLTYLLAAYASILLVQLAAFVRAGADTAIVVWWLILSAFGGFVGYFVILYGPQIVSII